MYRPSETLLATKAPMGTETIAGCGLWPIVSSMASIDLVIGSIRQLFPCRSDNRSSESTCDARHTAANAVPENLDLGDSSRNLLAGRDGPNSSSSVPSYAVAN